MTAGPTSGGATRFRRSLLHDPPDVPALPVGDRAPRRPGRWWREVLLVAVFYAVYTAIRDLRGIHPVSAATALANARRIIGFERSLGIFHEAQVQHWALHARGVIEALDVFYGTAHFVVTAGVLLVLFFVYPSRYRQWRNTLAIATGLALVGFAVFPLMPPRLLPGSYGFTDTLRVVGGLWNFDSGPMAGLSDQYAAMPSLHFAWSLWCGLAVAGLARPRWAKVLALAYPATTFVCVIVTANHYFSDTVAGGLIVAVGYGLARLAPRARGLGEKPAVAGADAGDSDPGEAGPATDPVGTRQASTDGRIPPGRGTRRSDL